MFTSMFDPCQIQCQFIQMMGRIKPIHNLKVVIMLNGKKNKETHSLRVFSIFTGSGIFVSPTGLLERTGSIQVWSS